MYTRVCTAEEIEQRDRYEIMISPIPGGPASDLCRTLERILAGQEGSWTGKGYLRKEEGD